MAKASCRTLILPLILAYASALASGQAHAQFSMPYDPDFAEEPERPPRRPLRPRPPPERPGVPPETPPPDLPEEPVELPAWFRGAGPFLLLDRPDPDRIFSAEPATGPPREFSEFLLERRPFRVDQGRWNKMREDYEAGTLPIEEFPTPPTVPGPYEVAVASAAPKPPPPELELPTYGTSLSITGRKVIGFQFSERRYLRDQKTRGRPKSTNLLDINQQLQLRMQGKVGPKITVNVDYDDTKDNKQDISVVYTGDPNEVVQNASFGDIDLSLPATEFVSYNKQLFGIRVELQWRKRIRAIFIGSRTKGTTKTKQFKGNTQFVTRDILDTSYLRHQYYDLTFGDENRLPISAGTERIYLSRETDTQQDNLDLEQFTVDDLGVPRTDPDYDLTTSTGDFRLLAPGIDYSIDYVKGILTFRRSLADEDVVAVDFIDATARSITIQTSTDSSHGTAGNSGRLKRIKNFADVALSTNTAEVAHLQELKTFYSIGRGQIVRDDGRGNFFLRVLDKNRAEITPKIVVPPGETEDLSYPDTIEVDFENGIFQLNGPFAVVDDTSTADPEVYARQAPIHKRQFHVEFRFRLKTFFLEPSLVLQSEVVLLDGVRLTRNVDYFIDYESGFLTFFNQERIRTDSLIDVSYEVAPFAGVATESLLGTRIMADIVRNKWSVGTTLLYQSGSKPPSVPSINELAKSLLVYEADTQLKDIKIFSWLKGSLAGEIAQSRSNPNLSKRALIENMEGVKQDDSASVIDTAWLLAANPGGESADPAAITLTTEDEQIKAINPDAPVGDEDSQKVLKLEYDFSVNDSTEVSIVYVFSPTGQDFTQKTLLEIVMFQSAQSDNEINITLGGINEDSDGDGNLDTEDVNLDGTLGTDEDTGYIYNVGPPDKPSSNSLVIGADNGRIDTEDLNRNGRLDPADFSGDNFGYVSGSSFTDVTSNVSRDTLNWADSSKYHTLHVSLSPTATGYAAIKQLRISIRKTAGGSTTGSLKFARIAVVGNTWQRGQAGDPFTGASAKGSEAVTVSAVNNVDNPGYAPIHQSPGDALDVFNSLYGSVDDLRQQGGTDQISEQALELRYSDLGDGTTVYTKRTFARAIDISQHKEFSFLLYGNVDSDPADVNGEKVFFLRAGSDKDYFEIRSPINFSGWRKVVAKQVDLNKDQLPDVWQVGGGPAGTVITSTGSPKLQQVGIITAGIYSSSATSTEGAVWLNEIHVDKPIVRTGIARKLQLDLQIPGWADFGAKYRFVDRNYQTPTTVVANQDNRQDSGYLNFKRLKFLPMNFNLSRSVITTPNTAAVGDLANLTSIIQEGKVTTWNGKASGNFSLGKWPRASLTYDRQRTETSLLSRLDDRQTYNSQMSYGVPGGWRLLPRTIDLTYRHSEYKVQFDTLEELLKPTNFNTTEYTKGYGVKMAFSPWKETSFNPSYSLTTVDEKRTTVHSATSRTTERYQKSLTQSAGFSSQWRLLRWLRPSVSYNVNTIENNILQSTVTVGGVAHQFDIGDLKTVNRTASGNINLTLRIAELFPRTRLFRSMSLNNSYQIQDGDTHERIEKELDTKLALWIRTPLSPSQSLAQRTNLTLRDTYNSSQRWSPLEGYDIRGRKSAFKTLSLSNSFVQSIQRNEKTGTPSKTISTTLPDMLASLGQIERLLHSERWMKNTQINLKYSARNTRNVGISLDSSENLGSDLRTIVFKRFDTSLSFNLRTTEKKDLRIEKVTETTEHRDITLQSTFDIRKFRFTPKVDYRSDVTTLGTGVDTRNITIITPSMLIRADLALPRKLYLPFSKRSLTFANRVIWTTSMSMAMRSSPVTNADNSKLFNLTTNADYEIAKNLRMSLNGAMSRLWHKFIKEDEFISYQFGTTLTFQF